MKLSDAIRKHLTAWQIMDQMNEKLAVRGLSIEAIPCLDPDTGSVKFRNARVIIDVKKALPKLADFFIDNGLPMPIDPADPHRGAQEFFDIMDDRDDGELSSLLGFDPTSASDMDRFIEKNGGNKGFDVITPQPTKPYRPGERHPSVDKSYGGTD